MEVVEVVSNGGKVPEWGCGRFLGLISRRQAETYTILDGTQSAKGYLDPFLVVPPYVLIYALDELLHGDALPAAVIKHLGF